MSTLESASLLHRTTRFHLEQGSWNPSMRQVSSPRLRSKLLIQQHSEPVLTPRQTAFGALAAKETCTSIASSTGLKCRSNSVGITEKVRFDSFAESRRVFVKASSCFGDLRWQSPSQSITGRSGSSCSACRLQFAASAFGIPANVHPPPPMGPKN